MQKNGRLKSAVFSSCTQQFYCLIASIANVKVTSSLTAGAYLPALNSERLMWAVALAPHESFFSLGCGAQVNEVTVRVTGLVTPFRVRVPSTLASLSPSNLNLVDL